MVINNAIVVLYKEDIPSALALLAQLNDAEIWVFEPHLLDKLSWAGAGNCRLVEYYLDVNISQHVREAEQQSLSIELNIDNIFKESFPEAMRCHWQYQNIFLQLLTLNSYACLWEKLLSNPISAKMHILVHDMPARFSAPSFWPSLLLLEKLNQKNLLYSAYSYNTNDDSTQLIPAGQGFNASHGKCQAFVHLPTCFYDSKYFVDEIQAVFPDALNFKSMDVQPLIWNVDLPTLTNVELCSTQEALGKLPAKQQLNIARVTEQIEKIVTDFFSNFAHSDKYISRQANYLATQYEAQMIFFRRLEDTYSSNPPSKVILSNHDAGLHGPLISFAKAHSIPMVLLPHSKIFNFPIISTNSNIVALTHPLQGNVITNVEGGRVRFHFVTFPETIKISNTPVPEFKRIGIILNDISIGGNISVNHKDYLAGLTKIFSWCRLNDIQCKVRVKPGASFFKWLIENIGFGDTELAMSSLGNISDFAHDCDICLMYDCPTSGAIELLKDAISTINTTFRPLSTMESSITSTKIVPRESVEESLFRLEYYRINPNELFAFRTQQYASYVESFAQSLPLRMFL